MDNNKPTIKLDADHMGTLLVLMSELHTYWMELYRLNPLEAEIPEKLYLMGNMEGRCLYDGLTQDDLDILEAWEEDLTEWKEAHGGALIPIDDAIRNAMEEFHDDPDWDDK